MMDFSLPACLAFGGGADDGDGAHLVKLDSLKPMGEGAKPNGSRNVGIGDRGAGQAVRVGQVRAQLHSFRAGLFDDFGALRGRWRGIG